MDDLISRRAAIDAIHEDADWLAVQGSDWQEERMERDKSILMSLPSAQPERKKGKWLFTDAAPHRAYCSVCYKTFIPNKEWIAWKEDMIPRNYCPNCGARMEEEK